MTSFFGRFRQADNGEPPRYTRYINRIPIRWPLFVMSIFGVIWAIASGVTSIRNMSSDGETGKEKVVDLILAIMQFIVGGIGLYCVVVTALHNERLAKFLRVLAPVGALIAIASAILSLVFHFEFKSTLISQCTSDYTGGTAFDRYGHNSTLTASEAESYCKEDWNRGTWRVIGWLIVVAIFSFIVAKFALQYYKQFSAPTSVPEGIPMQPSAYGQYPPPPPHEQGWQVPPYPGPPASGSTPYEKGEFHPSAEWAQEEYPPPPGAPPGAARGGEYAAQEAAWEQARTQGPTAHLTGNGAKPNRDSSEGTGYVVGNQEEDEAWEEARRQGVTAHLTGHATGANNSRRTDGEV